MVPFLKGCNDARKLLRLLAVLQSSLSKISSFGIHKRNLLEARVIIATYNNHRRLLSTRAFWLVGTTKVYSDMGAGVVIESISLIDHSFCKQGAEKFLRRILPKDR
jgi:hypothetical protein